MEKIEIRPIEINEIEKFSWTGSKTHLKYFGEAMKRTGDSKVVFLGAFLGDKAIGRCGIDFERTPGKAVIWMFNVHEDYQGQGIGSSILVEVEKVIKNSGFDIASLNVEEENLRAQELYLRNGYHLVGKGHESWEEDDLGGGTITYEASVVHMDKLLN